MTTKKHFAAALASALLCIAGTNAQATEIYPVDAARFMTNAKFDFKVEFDTVVDRKDVTIQINGDDSRRPLRGTNSGRPRKRMPKGRPS
mgnify:CR=1 FL=1